MCLRLLANNTLTRINWARADGPAPGARSGFPGQAARITVSLTARQARAERCSIDLSKLSARAYK
jgi:hypothetical protein